MKANAWNKSRVTPTITNFLVLIFSIMAPAMAKEMWRREWRYHTERETVMLMSEEKKKKGGR